MQTRFLLTLASIPIALAIPACEQAPRRPVHDITIAHYVYGGPPEPLQRAAQPMTAVTQDQPIGSGRHDRARVFEAAAPVRLLPLDTWRDRWPDAARDLDAWARRYPRAAETFFGWDDIDDERAEAFVEWAIGNRYEQFDAYLLTRHGWGASEARMRDSSERAAVRELLDIIRNYSDAWLEVVRHPHGIAWLGSHRPARAEAARSKAR